MARNIYLMMELCVEGTYEVNRNNDNGFRRIWFHRIHNGIEISLITGKMWMGVDLMDDLI